MRSYFSYDPEQDKKAPCREAGLKFEKGDILQIVNQDDPNWWQAIQYNDQGNQAGIIPSKTLKEKLALLMTFAHFLYLHAEICILLASIILKNLQVEMLCLDLYIWFGPV